MSVSSTIAFRYLKASRDNYYFSWITLLSVLGVAIGIATMIVVLSVINGFETELRNRFLGANAHILVYRFPAGIKNHEQWEANLKDDFKKDIKATAPFIHGETMVRNQSILNSILIRGIDPQKRNKVQRILDNVRPLSALKILQDEIRMAQKGKSPETPSIILGKGLFSLLQAKIGDTIQLIDTSANSSVGQFINYKVVGIYESGLQIYDNKIGILSIPAAQKLFAFKDVVTGIEIGLHDIDKSDEISEVILQKYDLSVKPWTTYNRPAFEAIKQQKVMIGMIVWLVAIVAGLNILTTLFISINQKQKEISILKAIGANNRQIMALFIKQCILIGSIGSVLGVILAFGISKVIEKYEFIKIPEVYMLSRLPVDYDITVYASISLAGIAVCILAGLYPSWAATRISPTEGFTGGRGG